MANLTPERVQQIKDAESLEEKVALSQQYGVSPDDIYRATRGRAGTLGEYMSPEEDAFSQLNEYVGNEGRLTAKDYRPQDSVAAEVAGKAAMVGAITGSVDPVEAYRKVKQELISSGHSDLLVELERLAVLDESEVTRQAFTNILVAEGNKEEVDPEYLQGILDAYNEERLGIDTPLGRQVAIDSLIATTLRETPDPEDDAESMAVRLAPVDPERRLYARAMLESKMEDAIATIIGSDASTLEGVLELSTLVAPFYEQVNLTAAYNGLVDKGWFNKKEEMGTARKFFAGEILHELRGKFHELSKADPEEAMRFLEDFTDVWLNETGEVLGNNGMLAMFLLQDVGEEPPTRSSFESVLGATLAPFSPAAVAYGINAQKDWARWLSNLGSAADLLGFGVLFRVAKRLRMMRTGMDSITKGSLADIIKGNRPKDFQKLAPELVKNLEAARAHGTTPDEVADEVLRPRVQGDDPTAGPTNVADQMVETILRETDRKGVFYTDYEKANGLERIRRMLHKAGHYSYHPEKSAIGISDDGQRMQIDAVIGADDTHGFAKFEDARRAAEELYDGEVEFLYRNEFGTLKAIPDGKKVEFLNEGEEVQNVLSAPGEWYVRIRMEKDFIPEDGIAFGRSDVFTSDGLMGWVKRKFGDPSSKFGRDLVIAGHRAHDIGARLQTLFLNLVKSEWDKLPKGGKKRLTAVLEQGATEKKWYTPEELVEKFPDISWSEAQAYYTVRKFWDTVWEAQNRQLYRRLDGRGAKFITNEAQDFKGIGTPRSSEQMFDEVGSDLIEVWDAERGTTVSLTRKQAAMRESRYGVSFFKMEERIRNGKTATDYVMVPKNKRTRIRALPRNIMKYEHGYYPRIYEDKYYIREVTKGVSINGRAHQTDSRAVYVASSAGEAARYARRMNALNTDGTVEYVATPAKELMEGDTVRADIEALNISGRLFYSPRGEHLKHVDGHDAKIADPIETIQRMTYAVARHLSHDDFLDKLRYNFMQTYRSLISLTDDQLKTATDTEILRAIKKPANLNSDSSVQAAKALWNYIRIMSGMPPVDGQAYRRLVVSIADTLSMLSPTLFTPLSRMLIKHRNFAPLSFIRTTTFQMFIALNPIRQLPLQAQQQLYLYGAEPVYFTSGMAARQQTAALAAYAEASAAAKLSKGKVVNRFDSIPEGRLKAYAATAGMDVDEFKQALVRFHDSGLVDAIDEHMFISGGSLSPVIRPANTGILRRAGDAMGAGIRAARKTGFDSGEFVNMMASYLVAIHRFKKANPKEASKWYTDKYIDKVLGDARDLSLAMTKSGSFEWQHGWFANALQFFSIQQKAWLGFISNKTFSPMERAGIVAGQLALYGPRGLGLSGGVWYAWDKYQEWKNPDNPEPPSDKVVEFIEGGMVDVVVNTALEAMSGEDQDVRLSGQLAAGAGAFSTLEEKAVALLTHGTDSAAYNVLQFLAGPSGTAAERLAEVGGRAAQAAKLAWNLRANPEFNEETTREEALRALYTLAEVASGYSNAIKVKMWKNMRKNEVLMEHFPDLTDEEAFIQQWFGFSSADEQDHWELIRDMEMGSLTYSKDDAIREGDEIYDRWKTTFLRYGLKDGEDLNFQLADELTKIDGMVMIAYADDPIQKARVMERIRERMENDMRYDRTSLAKVIANALNSGTVNYNDLSDLKDRVARQSGFTEEERQQILFIIDFLMESPEIIGVDELGTE